ncbi:MAG TPA: anti-sigma factor [Bryobacteraceae bacterium]|nr:anti-sigma factor [Bryobacteraceae bacterium]
MTCEELRGEYGAWALGIADEPERSEIAAHLARECPECTAGVRSAMVTAAALSGAVTEGNPPRRLRRRIVSMVERKPKRSFAWLPWAVSAALAIALVSIAIPGRRDTQALLTQQQDMTKLKQALSILNDPAARDVTFGDPAALGRVFVSSTGVVLIAAHLPKIQDNQTFELWLLPGSGDPKPAGTFRGETISNSSSAVYVYQGSTATAVAVAVTVEPEGGSPQPTTTPFIVSKL